MGSSEKKSISFNFEGIGSPREQEKKISKYRKKKKSHRNIRSMDFMN